jgi:hypothetical protein
MRPSSLITLAAVAAGCNLRVPRGVGLPIAARVTVRAQATVVPAAPPVAMVNAAVPEFFGIPLDGANDIVFALDVSGSMNNAADGRVAPLAAPPAPAAAPSDPSAPPPAGAPTDPNAPPADPNAPPPPPGAGPAPMPMPASAAPVRSTKIEVAKAELVDALTKLPAGTRVDVIFFDSEVEAFAPDVVALDDATRASLIGYVSAETAAGSTALAPAMRTAFVMQSHRVVLLSDGLGNVNGNSDDVLRDAREAIRAGIRIDTIGIGIDQDRQLLGELAGESGGLYQAF